MKEIVLKVSDEDFDVIKKELVFEGTTKNIKFSVTEAQFRESPKFELESMKGELC